MKLSKTFKTAITVLVAILLTSCDYGFGSNTEIREACEKAYFEGQRDYANGDKRIEFTKDSCWVWIKSPWNDGTNPSFNPSLIHSRNRENKEK